MVSKPGISPNKTSRLFLVFESEHFCCDWPVNIFERPDDISVPLFKKQYVCTTINYLQIGINWENIHQNL